MKHCILAKYRPEVYPRRQELLPRIRQIFSAASELEGVSGASVYPNCVARDNRYDVLIVLDMAPEVYPRRQELLPRIRQIFSAASELEGVSGASVYPNCVARDNRYDVLIVLDMAPEALPVYDASAMHHLWKEEFGPLLAQKAIFDFEA